MVFTRQNHCLPGILVDYWECPMSAHVEERVDAPRPVSNDEERVSRHFIAGILAGLVELA